jgi:hypothetical protein
MRMEERPRSLPSRGEDSLKKISKDRKGLFNLSVSDFLTETVPWR